MNCHSPGTAAAAHSGRTDGMQGKQASVCVFVCVALHAHCVCLCAFVCVYCSKTAEALEDRLAVVSPYHWKRSELYTQLPFKIIASATTVSSSAFTS